MDYGVLLSGGADLTGNRGELEGEVAMPDLSAPTGLPLYSSGSGGTGGSNSIGLSGGSSETVDSDWEIDRLTLEGYSTLTIHGNVTLVVTDRFEMSDYTELEILSDSSLSLYIQKTCEVRGHAKLNQSTEQPSRLHVYMTGYAQDFRMANNAVMYAVLENSDGDVSLYDDAEFFGKLKGDRLRNEGAIHVDLDSAFSSGSD